MLTTRAIALTLTLATGISFTRPQYSFAQKKSAKPVSQLELYRAGVVPDRIILTLTASPATQQAITWRTDASVKNAFIEYAIAQDGPKFVRKLKRQTAKSETLKAKAGQVKYHSIVVKGLTPATKYVYRVGDGVNWSEFSHFTTASDEAKPFAFIYFGDSQNDLKSHWSRVIREAYQDLPKAAFILHAGDLVNRANSDAHWGEWFYAGGWINRTTPSIATPGNHEYTKSNLSGHWRKTFNFPENGPEGLEETVYYIDYQGVRLISLNSNVSLDNQIDWMHEIMKNNPCQWTIVTMHHPIYSTAKNRDNEKLRTKLQPVFDQHHVDIVLQGHDHTYGRTGLVAHAHGEKIHIHQNGEAAEGLSSAETGPRLITKHGQLSSDGKLSVTTASAEVRNVATGVTARGAGWGTVYVVSVSGPKMYELSKGIDDRDIFKQTAENIQLYQTLSIDGETLTYAACTATGKPYDSFVLKKRAGKNNELIEQK